MLLLWPLQSKWRSGRVSNFGRRCAFLLCSQEGARQILVECGWDGVQSRNTADRVSSYFPTLGLEMQGSSRTMEAQRLGAANPQGNRPRRRFSERAGRHPSLAFVQDSISTFPRLSRSRPGACSKPGTVFWPELISSKAPSARGWAS